MTPIEEYANNPLEASEISCPSLPYGFLRNCFSTYSNETSLNIVSPDHESSRDASSIAGTVTHIHTNDGSANWEFMYPGSIVRNGDYVYIYHRVEPNGDQPPWELWIIEHQISTGTQREIFVMQNDNAHGDYEIATGWGTFISIIEDRKVMVCDNGKDDDDDPPYYYVWIVDFDANTCTLDYTFPETDPVDDGIRHRIPTTAVVKVSNGDLHLLVWGLYNDGVYPGGWYIYDKNYTQDGEWIETHWIRNYGLDTNDSGMCPAIIVNHKYLVIPCSYQTKSGGGHFHTTYLFHVYDIDTKGVSHTYGNDEDSKSWVLARESWMEDATNHKLYIELKFGADDPNYDTYEFDPTTCTLNLTPISTGAVWMTSSNIHVYDWNINGNIRRTDNQALQNNHARPAYATNLSMLMDDNAEVVWFMDGANLVAYNIVTDIIVRSIATGITAYRIGVVHLGDCLVLTTLDEAYGSIVDYYLVT